MTVCVFARLLFVLVLRYECNITNTVGRSLIVWHKGEQIVSLVIRLRESLLTLYFFLYVPQGPSIPSWGK